MGVTDTSATVNYTVDLRTDTNVIISVGGTSEAITESIGSFEVTGLTPETSYDITLSSDLNETDLVIGTILTTATPPVAGTTPKFNEMKVDDLKAYASENNIDLKGATKLADIVAVLEDAS